MNESYSLPCLTPPLSACPPQVRNLSPRTGWHQEIVAALGGSQNTSPAAVTKQLPRAQVRLSHSATTHTVVAEAPNLNPRFTTNSQSFESLALGSTVSVKVFDTFSGLFSRKVLLGEAELQVGAIPSAAPTYVWLPLCQPKPRRLRDRLHLRKMRTGPVSSQDSHAALFGKGGAGVGRSGVAGSRLQVKESSVGLS